MLAAPSGAARDSLLEAIAAGEALAGLADRDAEVPTVAVRVDANYRITGQKSFLLGGGAWTHYLVTAERAADGDIGLYLVPSSRRPA